MNNLLEMLATPAWSHLMTALLHSLWLGVCWVVILAVLLRACGNDPERRYRWALATLAGFVASILVFWAMQDVQQQEFQSSSAAARTEIIPEEVRAPHTAVVGPAGGYAASYTSTFALVWAAGCTVMFVRLLAQIVASGKVRRRIR